MYHNVTPCWFAGTESQQQDRMHQAVFPLTPLGGICMPTLRLGMHGWTFYGTGSQPDPPLPPPPPLYAWYSHARLQTSDGTPHDIRYDRLHIDGYDWSKDKSWIRGLSSGTPHTAGLFGHGDTIIHWIQAPGAKHRLVMFCAHEARLPCTTGEHDEDEALWRRVDSL